MTGRAAAPYLCPYCRAACDGGTSGCPNCGAPRDRPGGLRASDADRDQTISMLTDHFQAGRLTTEEFDERSGRALRARTQEDLAALLADLPPDRAPVTDPVVGADSVRWRLPGRIPRISVVAIVIVIALVVSGGHNHHSLIGLVPVVAVLLLVLGRRARAGHLLGEDGRRRDDRDFRRDERDFRRDDRDLRRDERDFRRDDRDFRRDRRRLRH
jgi:hypothetical protein